MCSLNVPLSISIATYLAIMVSSQNVCEVNSGSIQICLTTVVNEAECCWCPWEGGKCDIHESRVTDCFNDMVCTLPPTTATPTTSVPTTSVPTTNNPTTNNPTTSVPTTSIPTTSSPTPAPPTSPPTKTDVCAPSSGSMDICLTAVVNATCCWCPEDLFIEAIEGVEPVPKCMDP
eukprot:349978_1